MMRRAVVLFNLGGPRSSEEIYGFLYSLFSDKAILPYPGWIRRPLARFIASRRLASATEAYGRLDGAFPLLQNTLDQAQALENRLGETYRVFVAMRHGAPYSEETLLEVKNYKPHELFLLPLYPQFSTTTTGSSFEEWDRQDSLHHLSRSSQRVCCYPENAGFIEAMADLILKELAAFDTPPRLLFSAHGLPQTIVAKGDPYAYQVGLSVKKVLRRLKEKTPETFDHVICFQSRVGKQKWLTPYLDDEISRAGADQKDVLVIPISFVQEHMETLVELDIDVKEKAHSLGIRYGRVPTVGCHPAFIEGLYGIIKSRENIQTTCPLGWKKCWRSRI